ncbi:MAG TPA: FliM/FliN family flagellar motor switch protein [Acidobacteriaceae bacterium]|jgi:flagellar motor switch protein FliN/FliY
MEPNSENKLTVATAPEAAPGTALTGPVGEGAPALFGAAARPETDSGGILGRMGMRLDVMVKVPSFCVRDLLALERGTVVETEHDHTQDVPVESGEALLAWAEFEVVNERLAVRLTRLA